MAASPTASRVLELVAQVRTLNVDVGIASSVPFSS